MNIYKYSMNDFFIKQELNRIQFFYGINMTQRIR